MHKDPTLSDFLAKIAAAAAQPDLMVSVIAEHRETSAKFIRSAERKQCEFVVAAYAAHSQAKAAGTLNELLAKIKENDASIKTDCTKLACLHSLIGYGPEGAQYASRDKGVLELLELSDVPVASAIKFIKEHGGLHKCYAERRKDKARAKLPDDLEPGAAKTKRISDLYPHYLQHTGDMAVVLVRLKDEVSGQIELAKVIQISGTGTASEVLEFDEAFETFFDSLSGRPQIRAEAPLHV